MDVGADGRLVPCACRAVRQTAEAENNITSVERILDYTRLPSEPPRVAEGAFSLHDYHTICLMHLSCADKTRSLAVPP